jgi:hypothetical protein
VLSLTAFRKALVTGSFFVAGKSSGQLFTGPGNGFNMGVLLEAFCITISLVIHFFETGD